MDIFLSVKVKEDTSTDLGKLLETLAKISALQSKLGSSGKPIDIEVESKDVTKKLEEIKIVIDDITLDDASDDISDIKGVVNVLQSDIKLYRNFNTICQR